MELLLLVPLKEGHKRKRFINVTIPKGVKGHFFKSRFPVPKRGAIWKHGPYRATIQAVMCDMESFKVEVLARVEHQTGSAITNETFDIQNFIKHYRPAWVNIEPEAEMFAIVAALYTTTTIGKRHVVNKAA